MSFKILFTKRIIKDVFRHQERYASCWSCGNDVKSMVSNLFCSNCNALQTPDKEKNYFNILGVKETYDVDDTELTKKYKNLQRYLHPDKYATRDKKELEISETYSSLVNEAYKTLQQPLSRGIYLLKLRGKEIPEKTELDQQFLMQIMEKNEEVENADTEAKILYLDKENKTKLKELQTRLSQAFFDGDMKRTTKLLSILKYYTSIDNQIQESIRKKVIIR